MIGLGKLTFGIAATVRTTAGGSWTVQNLADGQYIAEIVPERVIHQFQNSTVQFEVSGGSSEMIMSSAAVVDSIRHNSASPHDVTGQDGVTALDALVIINDLSRHSQRILQPHETDGFHVDVNNDGIVSALDALLVINFLGRGEPEGQSAASAPVLPGNSARMLNLAGSAVAVESAGPDDADTDDRADDAVVVGQHTGTVAPRLESLGTPRMDLPKMLRMTPIQASLDRSGITLIQISRNHLPVMRSKGGCRLPHER